MRGSVPFGRWLSALGLVFWTIGSASAGPNSGIGALMTALSARGQFNGAVLVAQDGKIVYRNAFGKANFQTGADFTPETSSNIGSVTKQFTAMAIWRSTIPVCPNKRSSPRYFRKTKFSQRPVRSIDTAIPDMHSSPSSWSASPE